MERPNLFQQLFTMWIHPEVVRRQAAGKLPKPVELSRAQVIWYPDGRPFVVRLNDEVQVLALAKIRDGVRKELGEEIFEDEIEAYETLGLPETEDPNCGHATMIQLNGGWFVALDARYNRGKSKVLLDRAKQFLSSAEHAHARQSWSALVYALFAAAEIGARSQLLMVPDPALEDSKKHATVIQRFNRWFHLGNAPEPQKDALNRLSALRPAAAYSLEPFTIEQAEADQLLAAVRELIGDAEARVQRGPGPRGRGLTLPGKE